MNELKIVNITHEVINNLITDEIKRFRHSPRGFLPFKNREILDSVIGLRGDITIGNAGSNERGYYTNNVTVRNLNGNILQINANSAHTITLSDGFVKSYQDTEKAIKDFNNVNQVPIISVMEGLTDLIEESEIYNPHNEEE